MLGTQKREALPLSIGKRGRASFAGISHKEPGNEKKIRASIIRASIMPYAQSPIRASIIRTSIIPTPNS